MSTDNTRTAGILESQGMAVEHACAVAVIVDRAGVDPVAFPISSVEIAGRVYAVVTIAAFWAVASSAQRILPGAAPNLRQQKRTGELERVTAHLNVAASGAWHDVPATVVVLDYAGVSDQRAIEVAYAIAIRSVLPRETAGMVLVDEIAYMNLRESTSAATRGAHAGDRSAPREASASREGLDVLKRVGGACPPARSREETSP